MEQIYDHKWKQYLNEEKPEAPIRMFVAYFVLMVRKDTVDSGVVANIIRAIPNVTTVSKNTMGEEHKEFVKALYHIKFVLDLHEDLNVYLFRVLKRELNKINGVRVLSYRGVDQIEVGKS